MSIVVTDFLLLLATVAALISAVTTLRIQGHFRRSESRLNETAEGLARLASRLEKLDRHIDEYWRGMENRVGKIHDTFESGRACRMGGTVAEVDLRMAHLNRKMDEVLDRIPRPGPGGESL